MLDKFLAIPKRFKGLRPRLAKAYTIDDKVKLATKLLAEVQEHIADLDDMDGVGLTTALDAWAASMKLSALTGNYVTATVLGKEGDDYQVFRRDSFDIIYNPAIEPYAPLTR